MTYPDYYYDDDYYYDEYYEDEYNSFSSRASSDKQTLTMVEDLYMWMKGDLTGYIYYTVDELAIAKGEFEMWLDADIDFSMKANIPDEGKMTSNMIFGIDQFYANYEVEFDDPLDIYDFPIYSYEDWTATSMMTKKLLDIRGQISCEMDSYIPGEISDSIDFDIDLSKEVQTPDTYGPVEVTFEFSNYGSEAIILPSGLGSECWIIESEDYWYDDNDDDYYNDDYYYEESSSSFINPGVPVPMGDPSDGFEYDAETLETPVESSAKATNYYSIEEHNVVSCEPSTDSSDLSSSINSLPTNSYDDPSIQPKTYSEVSTFKTVGRNQLLSKYPKDTKTTDKSTNDDDQTNMIIFGVLIAIVMIAIMAAIGIQVSKKRKISNMEQPPAQLDYDSVISRERPVQQPNYTRQDLDYHPDHHSPPQPQSETYYQPQPPQPEPYYPPQPHQNTQYQSQAPDYGYNPTGAVTAGYDPRPTQQQDNFYNPSNNSNYDPRPTSQPTYPPRNPDYTNDPYNRY
jgi:hypothetical protein